MRIGLLGGFRVSVGARNVENEKWRLRKAASLVKLLALTPKHCMHRERVMDLLWPEFEASKAANNFHYALHYARRVLTPPPATASGYLQLRGEQIILCPERELWVDVEALDEAAAGARRSREITAYEAAIHLYAGDLLPEDLYEEWAEERREQLRRTYLSLLVELASLYEEREEHGQAIEALRRAVMSEPMRESAHIGLMRLYALSGQRQEALGQYEQLRRALSRELGIEPSAESQRLYEEILAERFLLSHPPRSSEECLLEEPFVDSRHNLPAPRTSFIGREHEILEIKRMLAMTRLLTLTGAGGSGKTRLALEVAKDLLGAYPDGTWLVELAALSEAGLVPQAVAEALGVREQSGRPIIATLTDSLRPRRMLLVLDNCEHVIEACARLVDTLLGSCSHLRILTTSRESLGIAGEALWPVPPLSVPSVEGPPSVERLVRYEAVRLFMDRTRLRLPTFDLMPENAQAVAQVCRGLEGMPLAIELATARTTVLTVEQIAAKLNDSLTLLTAGSRTAAPRHQTLRATLEWSHELLGEQERKLFRWLSVFAGGWTLEAAEAVAVGEGIEQDDVLDLLSRLVEKSLVVAEAGRESRVRYRMLEPIRQCAGEKLEESGEAKCIRRNHLNFFLALAQEVAPKIEPKIDNADRLMWLERLEIEHDNLRAALRWALDTGEAETSLRLAGALFWFWHMRGYLSEGRGWFERGLAEALARTTARAEALYYAGYLAWIQGHYSAARSQLEESAAIWRELGGEQGLAHALWLLGLVVLAQGELAGARSLAEESVKIFRIVEGDEFGLSMSLAILGIVVLNQEDHARASSLLEESAAIARKMEDDWFLSLPLRYLGAAAFRRGDHDRAVALIRESLVLLRESGEKWYVSRSLECLAAVDAMRGDRGRAARLFGAGETMREAIGASQVPFYLVDYDRSVAVARDALGEEAFAAAWAEGEAMTPKQAIEYALSGKQTTSRAKQKPLDGTRQVVLSRREEEIAALVAQGLTNRHIAKELMLSKRTIDTHVSKILKKLGAQSRDEVADFYNRAADTESKVAR